MTTFEECRQDLLERGGPPALRAYDRWLNRPGYQEVHALVHGFEHAYLGRITRDEMQEVRARSAHALGDVRTGEQRPEVEDAGPPFAYQHLFHLYIEQHQAVPTWQAFSG